jgi:hypothetical protein
MGFMKHDFIIHSPTHFECQRCGKVWTSGYPNRFSIFCPGYVLPPKHDIIQHPPDEFECRLCRQVWKTAKPRSLCPGLPLYSQYNHEPLMSQAQLGYAGYKTAKALLPSPSGCYRVESRIVLLYDPALAVKNSDPRFRQRTNIITEVFWPLDWIIFLDKYLEAPSRVDQYNLMDDIVDAAYQLSHFTASEVEKLAGPSLHLKITPCLKHRSLQTSRRSALAVSLVKSVIAAYEKHRPVL